MALSRRTVYGDGITTQFAVTFPFLSRSHVSATVGGVPTAFTWVNDGLIEFAVAPGAGVMIVIKRTTPDGLTSFTNGARLPAADLNTVASAAQYQNEEQEDDWAEAETVATQAFRAYKTGSQVINSSPEVGVSWGAETFDTNNNFDSDVYTAPLDGIYLFGVQLGLSSHPGAGEGYRFALVASSGLRSEYILIGTTGISTVPAITLVRPFSLQAGQTVWVAAERVLGTGAVSIASGASNSHFWGYKL